MAHFIKSSVEQQSSKIINLDLVTYISSGKSPDHSADLIRFHFDKENSTIWTYKDAEIFKNDFDQIEGLAKGLMRWDTDI